MVAQVPNEETPAQVRTEETAEAPKLIEDSPDDAELPGAILLRQASVSSLPISRGDSSEHQGPDSSKLFHFFLKSILSLIHKSVSIFLSFFARPDSTEGGGESITGTSKTTTIDGVVADEPKRFESGRNVRND